MKSNRGQLDTNTSEEFDNDFMNELNQFEFEINNERQRRHSQQRNPFNGDQSGRSNGATPGKKVVRKKRHAKQRPDEENGRKSSFRASTKSVKAKKDDHFDESDFSSPYSSEIETSEPESLTDDKMPSSELDALQQQQQKYQQEILDANSKNGHFVEATKMLGEQEQYNQQNQQQYYAINDPFNEVISADGGRIVSDIDTNFDAPIQDGFDAEKSSIQNISTEISSPPTTEPTTFQKGESLTSEMSTDAMYDDTSIAKETQKSIESNSSETSTFRSKLNKVLSHESSQDSTNGVFGSSKWKLLKTLKEKRIEEKNNQEKIKEEESANKSSVSRGVTIRPYNFVIRFYFRSLILSLIFYSH